MADPSAAPAIWQDLMSTWFKMTAAVWQIPMDVQNGDRWTEVPTFIGMDGDYKAHTEEHIATFIKSWQTLNAAVAHEGPLAFLADAGAAMPEALSRFVQVAGQSFFQVHQLWLSHASRISLSQPATAFPNLAEAVMNAWAEMYDQALRPLLNIPQLGLMRFYQEKMNAALDRFHHFQLTLGEFCYLMSLPLEKAFHLLQEESLRMLEEGTFPVDFAAFYQLWIQILEGRYLTLLRSPEYIAAMGKALGALEDFLLVRDAITQDVLKFWAVPSQKEMDALYKEIHLLKRQVRKLAKGPDSGFMGSNPPNDR